MKIDFFKDFKFIAKPDEYYVGGTEVTIEVITPNGNQILKFVVVGDFSEDLL